MNLRQKKKLFRKVTGQNPMIFFANPGADWQR